MKYVKIPLDRIVERMTIDNYKLSDQERKTKLRQLLYRTGLRCQDVAAILDCQPQTVRVWASNVTRTIPYYRLKRLCVVLGYDIDTIKPKGAGGENKRYANFTR